MKPTLDYFFAETKSFPIQEIFEGIEFPWEALTKAKDYIKREITDKDMKENLADVRGEIHLYGNYSIGKNTVIYNDVTIMGPVIIGENCEIMPGAILRPGTVLGNNVVIGHGCEVKNSVVQNYAKIQSMCFVGDSVIGKSSRVGSGVIVANRPFNQKNIKVKTDDFSRELDTSFFGCVLGDNSRLGANAVTQPGTLIGPYSWIFPTTAVRGFIPAQKRVFHERPIVMTDNEKVTLEP